MMSISSWLEGFYKKKFGEDIVVLQHTHGATWNDGGGWNDTIIKRGDEIFRIYMPSDYNTDNLITTKMKVVMREVYVEA